MRHFDRKQKIVTRNIYMLILPLYYVHIDIFYQRITMVSDYIYYQTLVYYGPNVVRLREITNES